MAIKNVTLEFAGQVGVFPRIGRIVCDNTYAEVTAAGFLNGTVNQGFTYYPNDILAVAYGTNSATSQFFTITIDTDGIITLDPTGSDVALPVTANHIAIFTNTQGTIGDDATTAINGGNIQAGLSGTAGALRSFPSTAASGRLEFLATANGGDVVTTITNATMGQAVTLTIPDPAAFAAIIPVIPGALVNKNLLSASGTTGIFQDAGFRIIAGTTASFGGGSATNAFSVPGLTSASKGAAVCRTVTNSVAIAIAIPSTDTLTVTWTADPGSATTVDYIYSTATQT